VTSNLRIASPNWIVKSLRRLRGVVLRRLWLEGLLTLPLCHVGNSKWLQHTKNILSPILAVSYHRQR
jgi:hypothetical protein